MTEPLLYYSLPYPLKGRSRFSESKGQAKE